MNEKNQHLTTVEDTLQASYQLDDEELNTVLAALRTYQEAGYGDPFNRPDRIQEIAAPTIGDTSLDDSAIDALCERLNIM